ncbi:MAG: hypothetical protein M9916_10425 [Crocinitomicaceae bacterium]|nr:hypothetical protein [Crocinitomicaceae bacterium]
MELCDNKIDNQFHSLWIGEKLGKTELLTLLSFKEHGQIINIWTYTPIKNLPDGFVQRDANEIIPKEKVFKYSDKSKIDWGKGSYAGFSDVFRYKLLYEYGGWWVDMDVTCFKPFNIDAPYFFRNHWKLPVVGNVMKCPKGSELMKVCYERAVIEVTENNTDWHKPITILNEEIERFNLMKYRQLGLFNLDMQHTIEPYLKNNYPFPHDWLGVHWINSSNFKYKNRSAFNQLLKHYKIQ